MDALVHRMSGTRRANRAIDYKNPGKSINAVRKRRTDFLLGAHHQSEHTSYPILTTAKVLNCNRLACYGLMLSFTLACFSIFVALAVTEVLNVNPEIPLHNPWEESQNRQDNWLAAVAKNGDPNMVVPEQSIPYYSLSFIYESNPVRDEKELFSSVLTIEGVESIRIWENDILNVSDYHEYCLKEYNPNVTFRGEIVGRCAKPRSPLTYFYQWNPGRSEADVNPSWGDALFSNQTEFDERYRILVDQVESSENFTSSSAGFFVDNQFNSNTKETSYTRTQLSFGFPLTLVDGSYTNDVGPSTLRQQREDLEQWACRKYLRNIQREVDEDDGDVGQRLLKDPKNIKGITVWWNGVGVTQCQAEFYITRDGFIFLASLVILMVCSWYSTMSLWLSIHIVWQCTSCYIISVLVYTYIFAIPYFGQLHLEMFYLALVLCSDSTTVMASLWYGSHGAMMQMQPHGGGGGGGRRHRLAMRISWVLRKSVPPSFTSAAAACCAILIASLVPFPTLQSLGIFAALLLCTNFCLSVTFFATALLVFGQFWEFKPGIADRFGFFRKIKRRGPPCCPDFVGQRNARRQAAREEALHEYLELQRASPSTPRGKEDGGGGGGDGDDGDEGNSTASGGVVVQKGKMPRDRRRNHHQDEYDDDDDDDDDDEESWGMISPSSSIIGGKDRGIFNAPQDLRATITTPASSSMMEYEGFLLHLNDVEEEDDSTVMEMERQEASRSGPLERFFTQGIARAIYQFRWVLATMVVVLVVIITILAIQFPNAIGSSPSYPDSTTLTRFPELSGERVVVNTVEMDSNRPSVFRNAQGELVSVGFVWGLATEPARQSRPQSYWLQTTGRPRYQSQFDATNFTQEEQTFIVQRCLDLETNPAIQRYVVPNGVHCFMQEFQRWIEDGNAQAIGYSGGFPVPGEEFERLLLNWTDGQFHEYNGDFRDDVGFRRETLRYLNIYVNTSLRLILSPNDAEEIYDDFEKVQDEWNAIARDQGLGSLKNVYQYTPRGTWPQSLRRRTLQLSAIYSLFVSIGVAGVVMFLLMDNPLLSIGGIIAVFAIIDVLLAQFVLVTFGASQPISALNFISIAMLAIVIDHIVHFANAYESAPYVDRSKKVASMLGKVGPPLWASGLSIIVSSIPLLLAFYIPLRDLYYFLLLGIATSLLSCTIFLSAILSLIGPQGAGRRTTCDVGKYKVFIRRMVYKHIIRKMYKGMVYVCVPVKEKTCALWITLCCYYSPKRKARRKKEREAEEMTTMSTFIETSGSESEES